MLLHIYDVYYYFVEKFRIECKILLLSLKRLNITKDISMYICRHLAYQHNIFPHPSLHYEITHLLINYIDRGVNFMKFALLLKAFVPNIKGLIFRQKYITLATSDADLCFLINKLQLQSLCIADSTGEFWNDVEWNDVLKVMPKNSHCRFLLCYEHKLVKTDKTIHLVDADLNKNLRIYKYDDYHDGEEQMFQRFDILINNIIQNTIKKKIKIITI